jgi:hypothetical protein
MYLGQQAEWRRLLELTELDALGFNDSVGWNSIATRWLGGLKEETHRKARRAVAETTAFADARDLAVEVLAGHLPVNILTVKQFRDVADPDCACYQALVRCGRVIERLHDLREIESRLHLRIRRNPAIDVVGLLGLSVKHTETTDAGVVDVIQPIRSFWARASIREDLGEMLCWRTDDSWQRPSWVVGTSPPAVPAGAIAWNANTRPSVLMDTNGQLLDDASALAGMHQPDVAAVIARTEPQLVIESMLSNEWGDWGNPRWYRQKQAEAIHRNALDHWNDDEKLATDVKNDPKAAANPSIQQFLETVRKKPAEWSSVDTKPTFCIPCHTIADTQVRYHWLGDPRAAAWWYVDEHTADGQPPMFVEDVWFPPP